VARRRGRSVKTRIRDVDRGYKKLMKRLGVKARKARRVAKSTARSGQRSVKKLFKDAAKEIKRLKKKKPTAKQLGASVVTIGIHEEEGAESHGDDGTTVADVAAFNEFGLGVPERSFIRSWADEKENENKDRLRKIGQAVVHGYISSPTQGLKRFGVLAVGEIQQRISDGISPENAESTIKAKGSSKPLIDDGIMRSKITSKVKKRGASDGGGEEE
jgi:hypothetical protein